MKTPCVHFRSLCLHVTRLRVVEVLQKTPKFNQPYFGDEVLLEPTTDSNASISELLYESSSTGPAQLLRRYVKLLKQVNSRKKNMKTHIDIVGVIS